MGSIRQVSWEKETVYQKLSLARLGGSTVSCPNSFSGSDWTGVQRGDREDVHRCAIYNGKKSEWLRKTRPHPHIKCYGSH